MTRIIYKSTAKGEVFAPSSKSVAHRMLIAAALCEGKKSLIRGLTPCEDVLATIDCLRALGATIEYSGHTAEIVGVDMSKAQGTKLFCLESGSTLRFIIPLLWLSGERFELSGSERLFTRSMSVYDEISGIHGFVFEKSPGKIVTEGRLSHGTYEVRGDVSSQFITGLLFALSTLEWDSEIVITTEVESRDYINITLDTMAKFGVDAFWKNKETLHIKGGQKYESRDLTVEGDWSNAAFLDAYNLLGGNVTVLGMNDSSSQGDKIYRELFGRIKEGFCEIDLSHCPDLGPILFSLAAVYHGAKFVGVKRLRDKESDRISAMKCELSKFGAKIYNEENSVTVDKCTLHAPDSKLFGHNDHRIVMSMAVLCSLYGGEIEGAEAVSKSYPTFFEDLAKLGINSNETD